MIFSIYEIKNLCISVDMEIFLTEGFGKKEQFICDSMKGGRACFPLVVASLRMCFCR